MMNDELPDGWLSCTLGDVVDYGKTTKAEPSEIEEGAWILELEDIEKDTSKLLERRTFAERQSKSTKNRFEVGDVLYGKLRPYLNKVIIADQPGYCTTEIISLKPNAALEGRYLFSWLKHPVFIDYVSNVSHGLNMPRLGTDAGKAAPFILAPLAEQKRIADKLEAVLGRVDACRSRLDRVPDLLKRFRQSVLAAATSGQLTEDWRETTDTTEDWRSTNLGAVLTDIRYGTAKKCRYEPAATPVLRIPNIGDGFVTLEDIKFAEFEPSEIKTLSLRSGDLLMIRSNGSLDLVGRVALVSKKEAGHLYAGYLIRLRLDTEQAVPGFVSLSLRSPVTRAVIELTARSTSGVNNLNTEEIRSLEISLPSLAEQAEIVRRVEALFALADRIEARLATAQRLVERLTPATLSKAFRGDLVPQDPNDEPASKLLERLAANPAEGSTAKKRRQS